LFDDLAERRAERSRKSHWVTTVVAGIIVGVVGSVTIFLFV
jgi:hypothetical protein